MYRRSVFISLALLALSAGLAVALWEMRGAAQFNVVVLTVESARFGAFSAETTPNLWRAAVQGTRFTRHRSASAWTGANIVSILTGLSAFRHGIHSRDSSIPAAWDTPLDRLTRAGWRVAGIQPFMLIDGFRNLGLDVAPGTAMIPWLAAEARSNRPFFLWYHYLETHLPFEPVAGVTTPADAATAARMAIVQESPAIPHGSVTFSPDDIRWIEPLYRAQFVTFDTWFGEFWNFFNASGLRDRTILIVTTDHGEELLERGSVGHASTTRTGHLYDEITHIPLFVWLPPSVSPDPPRVVDAPSSHPDIMPTILARLHTDAPMPLDGRDLFSLPANRAWNGVTSRAGFSEPDPDHVTRFAAARVDGDWKLHVEFETPGTILNTSLYDLSNDPGEVYDLAAAQPGRVRDMMQSLLPDIVALRVARTNKSNPTDGAASEPPQWVFPPSSASVSYADLPSPLQLRWRGPENAEYRMQYRAGEGALALEGEIAVTGLTHDFGPVSREYWNRYIVPYGVFSLRLGPAGQSDAWTPWLTIRVRE